MLILGRKYKFTAKERLELKRKFGKFNIIRYTNKTPDEVLEELNSHLDSKNLHTIILNTKAKVPNELIKYLTNLQFKKNIELITIERFLEKYLYKCYIPDDFADLNYLQNIKPYSFFELFLKRVVDYAGVIAISFLTAPLMFYARYKIKKESPGESIFKQARVGVNGSEFECFKFRSMILNAEESGAMFASKDDPRVFKWGEVMRKTRIDELPQLLNVFKGDMHLIGPRPERKVWIEKFEKEIPYYHERHLVRPGITGWAQVNYPYGANAYDAKQKLMYDLYYIKYWSLWLEFKIVWKTAVVIFKKRGL